MAEISIEKIASFIGDYDSIYRFSRTHLVRPETVLAHVAVVSILSLYFADKINEEASVSLGRIIFDIKAKGEMFNKVLTHDADELVTGDIPRPTKYSSIDMRDKFKTVEKSGMKEVIEEYDLPQSWYKNWKNAKQDLVGDLIHLSDLVSVVLTCRREIAYYSNNDFKRIAKEVCVYIEEAKGEFETRSLNSEKDTETFLYNRFSQILGECRGILASLC
jgi:5'-deoxynucleotidase YfbR-like HD superfamily hydrolase